MSFNHRECRPINTVVVLIGVTVGIAIVAVTSRELSYM
jgi:hypothetical protein